MARPTMIRSLLHSAFLGFLALAGWVGLARYEARRPTATQPAVPLDAAQAAEERRAAIVEAASRFDDPVRSANLLVVSATESAAAVRTTVLFQEYGGKGAPIPVRRLSIGGTKARIDVTVVRFDGPLSPAMESLRGHAVTLLTRISGDGETQPLDPPDAPPERYRSAQVAPAEAQLWRDIGSAVSSADAARRLGFHVTTRQSDPIDVRPGVIYSLRTDAEARLSVFSQPMSASEKEMVRRAEQVGRSATRPGW